MKDKFICPEDGLECIYPERENSGCWGCPKIQEVLEQMKGGNENG